MKNHSYQRQQGAALLMMMLALIALSSALAYQYLGDMNNKLKKQNIQAEYQALVEAKENLLVFATSIPELYGEERSPGFLLCPDMNPLTHTNSGTSSGSCAWATSNAIGRLPAKVGSGTGFLYFSQSEKNGGNSLWYAIDDKYRYCLNGTPCYVKTNPLDESPDMKIGTVPIVAIIIAAGSPLSGKINGQSKTQQRDITQGAQAQWSEYIESLISNNPPVFMNRKQNTADVYNDQVVFITKEEFDSRIKAKVLAVANENNYCNVPPSSALHWFNTYEWKEKVCP